MLKTYIFIKKKRRKKIVRPNVLMSKHNNGDGGPCESGMCKCPARGEWTK